MSNVLNWSKADRFIAVALVILWALIYLPNLRTNPNWYGDEGIVLEEAITTAKGTPRYGPIEFNFISPNPHPPVYLLVLAVPMKVFGPDILYGRLLQALVGLATGGIAFWVGSILINRRFGFLCAALLLTYPEAALHYRWVRGHPMQGMLSLACVGFLIRYLQTSLSRHILLASLMSTLALGVHYLAFPLLGMVLATELVKNPRNLPLVLAVCLAFPILFGVWMLVDNSWSGVLEQLGGALHQGLKTTQPKPLEEIWRMYRTALEFIFLTPTVDQRGVVGADLWITGGFLGICVFPNKSMRWWLVFFAMALMAGVFFSRDNPLLFMYRTFAFIPLLAIGLAGVLQVLGSWLASLNPSRGAIMRILPAILALTFNGSISVAGSVGQMRSKIDRWTVQSSEDAERAMAFVNQSTKPDDYVVMPDQLFWLYQWDKKAQLIHCAHFDFGIQENATIGVSKDRYWFDPGIKNAKYIVLAAGNGAGGNPIGIDAIFWLGYEGPQKVLEQIQREDWPLVFQSGEYRILANPRFIEN